MRARRPSLTARMATQLDRLAWALEATLAEASRPHAHDPIQQECRLLDALRLSIGSMADEARALVAEHKQRTNGRTR